MGLRNKNKSALFLHLINVEAQTTFMHHIQSEYERSAVQAVLFIRLHFSRITDGKGYSGRLLGLISTALKEESSPETKSRRWPRLAKR